jgi:DNA-binding beta-propeller fold protein YncE
MFRKEVFKALFGLFILSFLLCYAFSFSGNAAERYEFVTKWGSSGSGDSQFANPYGIAVDSSGNVYVVDAGNYRIQKFDSNGRFITQWGGPGSGNGQFGQFYVPAGIAVDSSGNVYVADAGNNRIQKFRPRAETKYGYEFVTKWGSVGLGDGQFYVPSGIAVDSSGNVYVADGNCRIQKFRPRAVTKSGYEFVTKWGSLGSGDGQFRGPLLGIAVDSRRNVYVADYSRIQKFSPRTDGSYEFVTKWGSFDMLTSIAVDPSGNVYVADRGENRIQKFRFRDGSYEFVAKWGGRGSEDGQFDEPTGVAVDSSGNVYVADRVNNRIQKFKRVFVIEPGAVTPRVPSPRITVPFPR